MSTATVNYNGPAGDIAGTGRRRQPCGRVEHPTSAQRLAMGKAARVQVPRSSHADWRPAPSRRDLVAVFEEQAQTRVPELVPIRHGRMLVHVDGHPRIISDPPLIVPIEELASPEQRAELAQTPREVIRSYRRTLTGDRRRLLERFRYVHAARKVVGVGSVGTRAWIVLMLGNDAAVAIAGYLGSGNGFDRAMAALAEIYADQNDADCAALKHAVDAGRITAETDL